MENITKARLYVFARHPLQFAAIVAWSFWLSMREGWKAAIATSMATGGNYAATNESYKTGCKYGEMLAKHQLGMAWAQGRMARYAATCQRAALKYGL